MFLSIKKLKQATFSPVLHTEDSICAYNPSTHPRLSIQYIIKLSSHYVFKTNSYYY